MSSIDTENTENTEDTENTEAGGDTGEDVGSTGNDWIPFARSVVEAFIQILIIGLLGANFVYLTRIDLDFFFSSDPTEMPYTSKVSNKKSSTRSKCGVPIDFTQSKLFDSENKYISGMFTYGFPYSMEGKGDTFGGFLSNWFVNKVKYSYVWLRTVIKAIIDFTGSTCAMSPDSMKSIVPFIVGPFAIALIMVITFLWWIPTLISVFWNEDQNWGMLLSFAGLFFGWTWFIPIILAFIQIIGVMFSFILFPSMLNGKKIMEIMGEPFNSYYLTLLFLILVSLAAFANLNIIIAIVMTAVFALRLIPPGMNPLSKKSEEE